MSEMLRGIVRTVVIAGTATAMSNRVSRIQYGRWADQAREQLAAVSEAGGAPKYDVEARLTQLEKLGELKARGILDEREFAEQKAHILAA
jgi:Short C-terminal domain